MTLAVRKALELHQPPATPNWRMDQLSDKIKAETLADIRYRQLMRSSILSDEWPRCVLAFRTLMQLELPKEPTPLSPLAKTLHASLLAEEAHEFASSNGIVEATDGLIDIIYVALGALLHMGLTPNQITSAFTEVHASNMTKVMDNGKPLINDGIIDPERPIGKVLKTSNYISPDLAAALGLAADSDPVTYSPEEDAR